MFHEKNKSSYLVTILVCNRHCVCLLMKKNDNILTHFGDALYLYVKSRYIFFILFF